MCNFVIIFNNNDKIMTQICIFAQFSLNTIVFNIVLPCKALTL